MWHSTCPCSAALALGCNLLKSDNGPFSTVSTGFKPDAAESEVCEKDSGLTEGQGFCNWFSGGSLWHWNVVGVDSSGLG